MNDDLTRLEHVLRERAAEVPSFQEMPSKMLARARRRIVRNALASVVAAGLIIAGASVGLAGLGALRGPNGVVPRGPSSSPPGASTPSCVAADLRATASLQGAAGSVVGSIDLANVSTRTCTLEGRPTLTLLSSSGHEVKVRVVPVKPQWKADAASAPHGWPVVRLRSGSAAAIRVAWTNPCPQLTDPALWTVDLGSGRGALEVQGAAITPPPCNGPTLASTLEVGPFEPGAGG
jgi:Protein of unknown function (DUF4232)